MGVSLVVCCFIMQGSLTARRTAGASHTHAMAARQTQISKDPVSWLQPTYVAVPIATAAAPGYDGVAAAAAAAAAPAAVGGFPLGLTINEAMIESMTPEQLKMALREVGLLLRGSRRKAACCSVSKQCVLGRHASAIDGALQPSEVTPRVGNDRSCQCFSDCVESCLDSMGTGGKLIGCDHFWAIAARMHGGP